MRTVKFLFFSLFASLWIWYWRGGWRLPDSQSSGHCPARKWTPTCKHISSFGTHPTYHLQNIRYHIMMLTHTHTHTHPHTRTHTHTHTHTSTHTHTHIITETHTHTHAHIITETHTHWIINAQIIDVESQPGLHTRRPRLPQRWPDKTLPVLCIQNCWECTKRPRTCTHICVDTICPLSSVRAGADPGFCKGGHHNNSKITLLKLYFNLWMITLLLTCNKHQLCV